MSMLEVAVTGLLLLAGLIAALTVTVLLPAWAAGAIAPETAEEEK